MSRVAIVHDWLTGMRGGERVLDALLELYPDADLFTLVHAEHSVSPRIEARPITTSFLQRLPFARTRWRYYLPLFPLAIERLDVSGYDLVISSSHCSAKAIRPGTGALHVCYCHTPMRYVWDQYDDYFGPGRAPGIVRLGMRVLAPRLRAWDRRTASRVHDFVANSKHVAGRISRTYGREARVVYPPVDVARFTPAARREDFYLVLSALVPYKRVDITIAAFRDNGRRLVVVGDGPEYARLRRAASSNVEFAGHLPDAEVASLLARCRAFVQAAEEDFGIACVEAQAAGAPAIAYGRGGAAEIVREDTGVLFAARTPESLNVALERAESMDFDPRTLAGNARRFSRGRFLTDFQDAVAQARAREEPCASFR